MKYFKDFSLMLGRDADAVVLDGVKRYAPLAAARHRDPPRAPRVEILHGVIQQVRENLIDLGRITQAVRQGSDS